MTRTTGTPAPSRGPHLFVRLPPISSTAADTAGRATSSQRPANAPVAFNAASNLSCSVLEQVGVGDRRGPASTEDGHDDREPDDDLRRGDGHHEERHHLPLEITVD